MQTLVLLFLAITSLVIVGGAIVAFVGLRRAPEGVEDENGFHATEPAQLKSSAPASATVAVES